VVGVGVQSQGPDGEPGDFHLSSGRLQEAGDLSVEAAFSPILYRFY
jgi:hypothetical protein